ncbi:MAG TPA: DUF2726 domain-containing protein [Drouetiella sp.]|jgi:Protein of unknown function (DUF2726)
MSEFLNSCELSAFNIMQPFVQLHGCQLFPKVKLGDVIQFRRSGIEKEHFEYASKAHFDFIVVKDNQVLFAIEIDGPNHYKNDTAPLRDELKKNLCQRKNLELLRIDLGYLNEVNDQHVLPLLLHNYFVRQNTKQISGKPRVGTACFENDSPATTMLEQHAQTVNEKIAKYKTKTSNFETVENGISYSARVLQVEEGRYCIGQGSAHPSGILGTDAKKLADVLSIIELGRQVDLYQQNKKTAKPLREVELLRSVYSATEIFPEVRRYALESYSNQH